MKKSFEKRFLDISISSDYIYCWYLLSILKQIKSVGIVSECKLATILIPILCLSLQLKILVSSLHSPGSDAYAVRGVQCVACK